MTVQIAERLIVEGQEVSLCEEPLAPYLALMTNRPRFDASCSALWRGYVGTWELRDGRLWLVAVSGELESGASVSVDALFPGEALPIFAGWYSGTLRVPQGQLLDYVHCGYSSIYERDLLVDVEHGVVVKSHLRTNAVALHADASCRNELTSIGSLAGNPDRKR